MTLFLERMSAKRKRLKIGKWYEIAGKFKYHTKV